MVWAAGWAAPENREKGCWEALMLQGFDGIWRGVVRKRNGTKGSHFLAQVSGWISLPKPNFGLQRRSNNLKQRREKKNVLFLSLKVLRNIRIEISRKQLEIWIKN